MMSCDITQTICSTFCIRDIRRTYNHIKHISVCINHDMSFSTFDALSAIISTLTYPCGCFDGLTIDNTRGWFNIACLRSARFCQNKGVDGYNCSVFRPFLEVITNNPRFWQIMWQIAPLATRTKDIQHAIDNPTAGNFNRSTRFPNGWSDKRFDDVPLRIGHIGRVGGSVHGSLLVSCWQSRAVSPQPKQQPTMLAENL